MLSVIHRSPGPGEIALSFVISCVCPCPLLYFIEWFSLPPEFLGAHGPDSSKLYEQPWSLWNFPCSSVGNESASNAGDLGSVPGLGRSPGEGNGNPLQYSGVFCPGESYGQRSLTGYSPWGCKSWT